MKRRTVLIGILAAFTGLIGCTAAVETENEPEYPLEAVEMIAPAGRGSGFDLTIRSISQCLTNTGLVSVPLPVTNKPGGGGCITMEYLDEMQGQDKVISIFSPPICLINLNGSTELNYKENTTPIAQLIVDYGCFAVRADSPYQSLDQVMEKLKEDPGSVFIGGTSTAGSMDHIQFLKIARAAGVDNLNEIRYEGFVDGGAVTQLMGGRVDILSSGISDTLGLVESGDIRVLAVTSDERLEGEVLSQLPTCRELGIDAGFITWRGIFGPADMPEYAVVYWENILKEMSETKEWQVICKKYGWTMEYKNHEEFAEFLEQVNEEYKDLLADIELPKD